MTNKNHLTPDGSHDSLDVDPSDKQIEIAQLSEMFKLDSAPEPTYSGLEQSLEQITPPLDHPENTSYSAKEKIRSRASSAGLYLTATSVAGKIANRLREGRAAREAKFAVEADDGRLRRISKFMGRNALRIASGTMIGLAGVAAVAAKTGQIDSFMHLGGHTPNLDPSHTETFANITPAVDTRYIVGGHGDPTSRGLNDIMNGLQGHGAKNTVTIQNPAEIAPFPSDSHTLNQSADVASSQIWDAYQKNPSKPIELIGYSEGTQAIQDAANKIAAQNGGELPPHVKVFLIATPNAENSGFFNTPYVKLTKPVLESLGISTDRPIPKGAHVIAMNTDFWANSGDKPVTTQLSQLIGLAGDGHRAPTDGMRSTTTVIDGTVYETRYHHGTQTAALRVLEQKTPIKVTPAMDKFGQAIAPQGEVGKVGPTIQAENVIRAGADLAKEGLHDRGINADATVDQVAAAVPRPLAQQALNLLDLPNQLGDAANQTPAPSGGGTATMTETVSRATANAPAAPQIPTEQIQQAVNDTANTIKKSLPPQMQQQVAPIVEQTQSQVNNFIKQFGPK